MYSLATVDHNWVAEEAARRGVSKSEIVRAAIAEARQRSERARKAAKRVS